MPCFLQIFARTFEKAQTKYFIYLTKDDENKLEKLLRNKLEDLSGKPIRTHELLRKILEELQRAKPVEFLELETWLLQQIRKLRVKELSMNHVPVKKKEKKEPKRKKKKREPKVYA
ncbi:MAG: hypothetical protein ACE5R6_00480 [Candidatus Heimdallarchaeota archaeon]